MLLRTSETLFLVRITIAQYDLFPYGSGSSNQSINFNELFRGLRNVLHAIRCIRMIHSCFINGTLIYLLPCVRGEEDKWFDEITN